MRVHGDDDAEAKSKGRGPEQVERDQVPRRAADGRERLGGAGDADGYVRHQKERPAPAALAPQRQHARREPAASEDDGGGAVERGEEPREADEREQVQNAQREAEDRVVGRQPDAERAVQHGVRGARVVLDPVRERGVERRRVGPVDRRGGGPGEHSFGAAAFLRDLVDQDGRRERPELRQDQPGRHEVRALAGACDLALADGRPEDHEGDGRNKAEIENAPAKDHEKALEERVI